MKGSERALCGQQDVNNTRAEQFLGGHVTSRGTPHCQLAAWAGGEPLVLPRLESWRLENLPEHVGFLFVLFSVYEKQCKILVRCLEIDLRALVDQC